MTWEKIRTLGLEQMTDCLNSTPTRRYKKYVFLDPLAGAITKTHVMLGAETEEKLFDAPLSISKREQLEQQVEIDDASVGGGTAGYRWGYR